MIDTETRLKLKTRLKNRQRVFGCWHSFANPGITEIFTRTEVDFIGIDVEHSTISQEQSQHIMRASQAAGIPCLPRIASHNGEMIKRLLDSGADGIIVPMVSTTQEIEQIINWCKYSPVGRRSFGVARAQGYGFDYQEYTSNWNRSSSLIIQIETVEGVNNIDKLLSYGEIDGVMVGPFDLSGSLGIPGQIEHPKVLEAVQKVNEACLRYKKASGSHLVYPSLDDLRQVFAKGAAFAVISTDLFVLWKWAEQVREQVKILRQEEK